MHEIFLAHHKGKAGSAPSQRSDRSEPGANLAQAWPKPGPSLARTWPEPGPNKSGSAGPQVAGRAGGAGASGPEGAREEQRRVQDRGPGSGARIGPGSSEDLARI